MTRKYAAIDADIRKVKDELEGKTKTSTAIEIKYNHEAIEALGEALLKVEMSALVSGEHIDSALTEGDE